jgi:hypothetical protein
MEKKGMEMKGERGGGSPHRRRDSIYQRRKTIEGIIRGGRR